MTTSDIQINTERRFSPIIHIGLCSCQTFTDVTAAVRVFMHTETHQIKHTEQREHIITNSFSVSARFL